MAVEPTPSWLRRLLEQAELRVEGPAFNAESFARREEAQAEHGAAVSYELALTGEEEPGRLAAEVIPKLQDHLRAKSLDPAGPPGLLVWIWHADRAHLFTGPAFARALLTPAAEDAPIPLLPAPPSKG